MATENNHIALMFNDIAPTYDKLNHILSLNVDKSWRRKAVHRVKKAVSGVEKPLLLDVACGTADSTIALAKINDNVRVNGVDISEGMLKIGEEKVGKLGLNDRIIFSVSSAENIDFQDDIYDAALVAFGVRNFSDRETGLKEILRVLKPNGTLIVLELSEPQNIIIRWFYNLYFKHILPFIGKCVSGNKEAYRYLQKTVEKFPMPKEFIAMLESCGYSEIKHKALTFGLCRIYQAKKV
ncbi:MAG: bifunctional demethylmenaquinone methyltransferase/2-methoxy-6-polyprenyl-1,4-benzoquinol methylase UbiE [Bacteroidales bacterium]|nr:bifunctional demethylmenaquinone methyltransferase/2-methoxy-6-polyprenyl-1,4-benzoquinol methylase UbiE [Bacteroidales bacterium]